MYSTTFVLLSFEGPDPYASVGGLSTRVCGLAEGLAALGYETHLFFVGDPNLPPQELRHDGRLHLYRWCQWISEQHPANAYDGEEWKADDLSASLPQWLATHIIAEQRAGGGNVVVLAEEWQTVGSIIELRRIVEEQGWRDHVYLVWNANDDRALDSVPWDALQKASAITTVSRYMRGVLHGYGVEARVVPNGIDPIWLKGPSVMEQRLMTGCLNQRVALAKPESWDAEGWEAALGATSIMKRMGMAPLLIAGDCGAAAARITWKAEQIGLTAVRAGPVAGSVMHMAEAVRANPHADVVLFRGGLSSPQRQLLFNSGTAVLGNAGRQAFGMAGLEAMASGGVAMVGCSGEDYATPWHDSISLQTMDPWEIVHNVAVLQDSAVKAIGIRKNARQTAARYTWQSVIRRCLLPALSMIGVPRIDVEILRGPKVLGPRPMQAKQPEGLALAEV